MRLQTLGVGAMRSPRYAPAGLLVSARGVRVMLDGGPGAEPERPVDAWLLTDNRSELASWIRRRAGRAGVAGFAAGELVVEPLPVAHTNHPTYGYRISGPEGVAVWAPEFVEFPGWAAGCDLMFAEAASWARPILFAGRVGGHMPVLQVAKAARAAGVRRLVFAHIGRPTIAALEAGLRPPFGEVASDRQVFWLRVSPRARGRERAAQR